MTNQDKNGRRRALLIAIPTLLVLVVAATLIAADGGDNDVEVFITSEGKEQTHLSLTGEDGLADGNARVEHGRLVDDEANDVGTVVSRFHYIDVRDAEANDFLFYLDCTIRLEGGSIAFGGAGEFANIGDGGEEFAILGGTGAYSGSTGQVTIAPGELGTRLLFQFDN